MPATPRYIIPSDFVNLLNRVNPELARRNGNGNISQYANIGYSVTPAAGGLIRQEHIKKIYDGLALINPSRLPQTTLNPINEGDITALEALIALYEVQPRGATSNNDCASACTGMCITQCTTSCGGSCSGSCQNSCAGYCSGCGGSCSNDCTGCSSGCQGECKGTCSTCSSGCSSGCTSGCTAGCKGCGPCTGCYTGCTSCTSCSGSCSASCHSMNY